MKKLNYLLFLAAGMMIFLINQWPTDKLRLVFCDVGQGDAILMIYQNKQILVDSGPDNSVLTCLGENMPFWDRQIEAVITTHKQKDHSTGLKEIKGRYQIKEITDLRVGDEVTMGPISLKLISGVSNSSKNQDCLVFLGEFNDFSWLLTADITEKEEKGLLADLNPITVLKVAHHGSKYSTSEAFLAKIKPQLAVISVGKNSFGHPTKEVLGRLASVKTLRTDKNGQVAIVSDGRSWYIKSDEN